MCLDIWIKQEKILDQPKSEKLALETENDFFPKERKTIIVYFQLKE